MFRDTAYQFVMDVGIGMIRRAFPNNFGVEPVKPSDRYLEYHFAASKLSKPPARILDIGCTGSLFPLILSAYGYDVVGIDVRDYPITKYLQFPRFQFKKHDISSGVVECEGFDYAIAISTIEHIGIPGRYGVRKHILMDSDDERAMAYIMFSLKKGGKAILTMPVGIEKMLAPYTRIYGRSKLKDLFKGFNVLDEQFYLPDKKGDWHECSKAKAFLVNATKYYSALGLYCLQKND